MKTHAFRMFKMLTLSFMLAGLVLGLPATLRWAGRPGSLSPQLETDQPKPSLLSQDYGKLSLSFEANLGQTDEAVQFLARSNGSTLFLTPSEAVLTLPKAESKSPDGGRDLMPPANDNGQAASDTSAMVKMKFVGADAQSSMAGMDELPGKINYFIGNDPSQWRTGIPTYAKVKCQDLYPGVDLIYYGNQKHLEYDFVVAPGADPQAIRVAFEGADDLEIDAQGNLVLRTSGGPIRQHKPVVYQEVDGQRIEVAGEYRLLDPPSVVGFQLADFDRSQPLVIDPVLVYSSYLGGSLGETGEAIAVDASGNAYVFGRTDSANFPMMNSPQPILSGGTRDAYISKLNASGTALLYSTYLGGSGVDMPDGGGNFADTSFGGIAVDAAGDIYVTGTTASTDFPMVNPIQPVHGGALDAFVTKLNPAGSAILYSTYLGGAGEDRGVAIALDASRNIYITGSTVSTDFPTANALQATAGGGNDVFVTKLNAAGSAFVYSTYLAGSTNEGPRDITVDLDGNAYVTGNTTSTNFPTVNPIQPVYGGVNDAFITKINAAGTALVYSTYSAARTRSLGTASSWTVAAMPMWPEARDL
ncbi:MAG: SBBP repeat-containing protein [Acidobacteria bacterium]|nr:SBBP repeat-containing protein [Acidobacteriota bacterium]